MKLCSVCIWKSNLDRTKKQEDICVYLPIVAIDHCHGEQRLDSSTWMQCKITNNYFARAAPVAWLIFECFIFCSRRGWFAILNRGRISCILARTNFLRSFRLISRRRTVNRLASIPLCKNLANTCSSLQAKTSKMRRSSLWSTGEAYFIMKTQFTFVLR